MKQAVLCDDTIILYVKYTQCVKMMIFDWASHLTHMEELKCVSITPGEPSVKMAGTTMMQVLLVDS